VTQLHDQVTDHGLGGIRIRLGPGTAGLKSCFAFGEVTLNQRIYPLPGDAIFTGNFGLAQALVDNGQDNDFGL
jgi:hypothetical protein